MSVSNDLGLWYKSIPPITRVWFTAAAAVPLTVRMGLLGEMNMLLFINPTIYHFQVSVWKKDSGGNFVLITVLDLAITHMCTLLSCGFQLFD